MSPEIAWKPPILYGFFKFLRIHGSISSENPQTPRRKRLSVIKAASFRVMHRKGKAVKFCRKLFGDRLVRGYPLILPGKVQSTLPLWSSGGSWGGPPLFLDQTDARRAEKNFFETPFPLPVGLDLPLRTPLQDYVGSCLFQSFYHYYTPYKMDSRHFLNHQQTLDRCFMQWKIPLKEKI